MLTIDKLKMAYYLLDKADNILYSLEVKGIIGDDIRDNLISAIDELEEIINSMED